MFACYILIILLFHFNGLYFRNAILSEYSYHAMIIFFNAMRVDSLTNTLKHLGWTVIWLFAHLCLTFIHIIILLLQMCCLLSNVFPWRKWCLDKDVYNAGPSCCRSVLIGSAERFIRSQLADWWILIPVNWSIFNLKTIFNISFYFQFYFTWCLCVFFIIHTRNFLTTHTSITVK